MNISSLAKGAVPRGIRERVHAQRIRANTHHLSGPRNWAPDPEGFVVTCLVKNGSYYVQEFVRHYKTIGAAHLVIMDNGSTDDTVAKFASHDRVTVYRCDLPIGKHQHLMKRFMAEKFVQYGWCLDVDIDEIFDYPFSSQIDLPKFLGYLDHAKYNAVVTQMLDMYSSDPIRHLADKVSQDLDPTRYSFYDLEEVEREPYSDSAIVQRKAPRNRTNGIDPAINWGGVRRRLFGLRCLLTKHSLFRVDRGLKLFTHPHFCDRASIADVSTLLRHYKLVSNCYETSTLNKDAFPATRQGYSDLVDLIEKEPDRRIYQTQSSAKLSFPEDLIGSGFLVASRNYLEIV